MFALRGPVFLVLFTALAVGVYVAVRTFIAKREAALPSEPRIRDPYAIAYLRADTRELIRVVALSLNLRGLLGIGKATFVTVNKDEINRVQVPLEKRVLQLCANFCAPSALVVDPGITTLVDGYRRDLTNRGLLADESVRQQRWPVVLAGCAALALIALYKIKVALAAGHHNIVFLILLTGAAIFVLVRRVYARRTHAGSAALHNLTTLFAALRLRRNRKSSNGVPETTLLAAVFGIYGVDGLDNPSWARMFPTQSSSSGGDSGSSCSSSSGCGGGGGGCGGCGS